MTFENLAGFLLLLLIPLKILLEKLGIFRKSSLPLVLGNWGGRTFVWKSRLRSFLHFLTSAGYFIFFILIVTAFADPVIHHQEKIYTSKGTEVLIVLDTSPSMASKDIGGMTRLEAAKKGIHTFVNDNQGAVFGLVAMASEAAAIVPPTSDHDLFLKRLDSLSEGGLGSGSAIGTGLSTAVYHLASSRAPRKSIVLITDGENNSGSIHPATAARLARENNISLYIFGIGTRGSVPIEYVDPSTGKILSGYYESDFNSASLEELAVNAGGKYYGIETTAALNRDLNAVSSSENVIQTFRLKTIDDHCFDRFLFWALVAFGISWNIRRIFLQEVL